MKRLFPILLLVIVNGEHKVYVPDPPYEVPCYKINPNIEDKTKMCYITWGL